MCHCNDRWFNYWSKQSESCFAITKKQKKKLKESKSRITHWIGYIFIGLLFTQIF